MIKAEVLTRSSVGNYRDYADQTLVYVDALVDGRKITLTFVGDRAYKAFMLREGMILHIEGRLDTIHNTIYVRNAHVQASSKLLFLPAGENVDEYI